MAAFDQVKDPLSLAVACARQIANGCTMAFNSVDSFKSDMENLRRDLLLFIGRVMRAFRGDEILTAAVRRELRYLRKDAFLAASWSKTTAEESDGLRKRISTDNDAFQSWCEANHVAVLEGQRQREMVNVACDRAQLRIAEICADADKATEIRSERVGQGEEKRRRKVKARSATKKTRNRRPRTVELLLVLLEDRTKANLNYTELAGELGVHVSSVSRAFGHEKYGPELRRRYHDLGIQPPGIRQI